MRKSRAFAPSQVFRRFMVAPYAVACGCTVLGALMLILDLGMRSKTHLLFAQPHLTFQTFGAYALLAQAVASLALACAWGLPSRKLPLGVVRVCQVVCLVLGLCVATYTGLLLFSMPAVPLWSNACVPVLFAASALSCGCALVLLCACLTGTFDVFASTLRRVMTFDVVAMALEVASAVGVLLLAYTNPYGVAAEGAHLLISGPYVLAFVLGFAVVGIAVPAVLEVGQLARFRSKHGRGSSASGRQEAVSLIAAIAVLVGGYALRYSIVVAGAHPEVWAIVS